MVWRKRRNSVLTLHQMSPSNQFYRLAVLYIFHEVRRLGARVSDRDQCSHKASEKYIRVEELVLADRESITM